VISLNLVLAGIRLGLNNRQVGEKWVSDDCSYLCKGLKQKIKIIIPNLDQRNHPLGKNWILLIIPIYAKVSA
jgi:hypothetical protein